MRIARAAGVAAPVLGFLDGTAEALPRARRPTSRSSTRRSRSSTTPSRSTTHGPAARPVSRRACKAYAVEFRGDHLGHRDTQIAIAEERGGRPPAPSALRLRRASRAATTSSAQALEIEVAAQEAYTALISQIRTKDYLLSAAFILVDEVRHMTVWQRVLGPEDLLSIRERLSRVTRRTHADLGCRAG